MGRLRVGRLRNDLEFEVAHPALESASFERPALLSPEVGQALEATGLEEGVAGAQLREAFCDGQGGRGIGEAAPRQPRLGQGDAGEAAEIPHQGLRVAPRSQAVAQRQGQAGVLFGGTGLPNVPALGQQVGDQCQGGEAGLAHHGPTAGACRQDYELGIEGGGSLVLGEGLAEDPPELSPWEALGGPGDRVSSHDEGI